MTDTIAFVFLSITKTLAIAALLLPALVIGLRWERRMALVSLRLVLDRSLLAREPVQAAQIGNWGGSFNSPPDAVAPMGGQTITRSGAAAASGQSLGSRTARAADAISSRSAYTKEDLVTFIEIALSNFIGDAESFYHFVEEAKRNKREDIIVLLSTCAEFLSRDELRKLLAKRIRSNDDRGAPWRLEQTLHPHLLEEIFDLFLATLLYTIGYENSSVKVS